MTRRITRGKLTFAVVALVLAAWGVLPFPIFEAPYGEVPIPGSATVHLPAGEVEVTLRTEPEVIESPRWKPADSQGNMLVRVWVVRIAQEADYHVKVDGEVYRPYHSSLTFGRTVWNEPLETLARGDRAARAVLETA